MRILDRNDLDLWNELFFDFFRGGCHRSRIGYFSVGDLFSRLSILSFFDHDGPHKIWHYDTLKSTGPHAFGLDMVGNGANLNLIDSGRHYLILDKNVIQIVLVKMNDHIQAANW